MIFILFFILCKSTLQCRKISHSEIFEKFQWNFHASKISWNFTSLHTT